MGQRCVSGAGSASARRWAPVNLTSASRPRRRPAIAAASAPSADSTRHQSLRRDVHLRKRRGALRRGNADVLSRQRRAPGGIRLRLAPERAALRLLPESMSLGASRSARRGRAGELRRGTLQLRLRAPLGQLLGRQLPRHHQRGRPRRVRDGFLRSADVRRHPAVSGDRQRIPHLLPGGRRLDLRAGLQRRVRPAALRDATELSAAVGSAKLRTAIAPAPRWNERDPPGLSADGACCTQSCDPERRPPCEPAVCTPP